MQSLFKTSDEIVYTYKNNKYNLNSISFCFTVPLNDINATHLNILEEITKDFFLKVTYSNPINVYNQLLKKDKILFLIIYFQYPKAIKFNDMFTENYLEIITNYIHDFLLFNDDYILKHFDYYKQRALKKIKMFESDIKTIAIKECFEILDDEYVSLFGKKEYVSNLSINIFKDWFLEYISSATAPKRVFLVGEFSENDEIVVSNVFPSSKLHLSNTIQPKKIKEPVFIERTFSSKVGYLVVALQIKNHQQFSKKSISIFSDYLGGGGFSILFNKVREERKLVYQIGATANINKGEIIITVKVSKENVEQVIQIIDDELQKLRMGIINETHYLSALNSFELNEKRKLDRPLTLTRSFVNFLTERREEPFEYTKSEFTNLIKQIEKVVTVSVLEG